MKKILLSVAMLCMALGGRAETQDVCQGWPANFEGVMLQGFWWDGYEDAKWVNLKNQSEDLSQWFKLIWVPNSGSVNSNPTNEKQGTSMGYDPCWWLYHNSCFGTEEELIDMIQTYKALGVGIIEDVVINHKKGVEGWCDFAHEIRVMREGEANEKTYEIQWSGGPEYYEITRNDDCNYVPGENFNTQGNLDTGDDFPGFRDLDHVSTVTQNNVKVYLDFLLNELGYAGFRYDLVKGYAPGFIQIYNDFAQSKISEQLFSVGEYWDNQTNIQNWIMNTGNRSAAFDFPLKYKLNEAISDGDYSALAWKSFSFDPNFSQYAITFVDNHDTGRESSRLVNNWSAANAFILASPGTPCIWYKHYLADPQNIRKMIQARINCGITNTYCIVEQQEAVNNNTGYILKTVGHTGSLYVQLGSAVGDCPYGYEEIARGDSYAFYASLYNFGYVMVSPYGGQFTGNEKQVTLTAQKAENGAWYNIGNGEVPIDGTATIDIGNMIEKNNSLTLSWRAIGEDNVVHTGSVTFTKREECPEITADANEVSVFFETDDSDEVCLYAWGGAFNWAWDDKEELGAMTLLGLNDAGKLVHKWTYNGTLTPEQMPVGLLFVKPSGQTSDFDFVNHGYYTAEGLSYHLGSSTVYFDNSVSNWQNVYYYAWDNEGHSNAAWPGVKIDEPNSENLYEVTLARYSSIIFNDPEATGVNQTEDLTIVDGKVYSLKANTVTFDNTVSKWNKVYYYAYTRDETPKTRWPGEVLTANTDGKYSVALQDAYTTVIFNDGTENGSIVGLNQTENLAVKDGEEYALDNYTVYYNNRQSNWEHVYCYAYANDQIHMVDWPGEEISMNSDGLYEITLIEGYKYVIFNDGTPTGSVVGVNQTEDLAGEDGEIYAVLANTVYFKNTLNWEHVHYYTYTSNEIAKTGWPGEEFQANDNGLFEVTLLEGYTKVIFNDGTMTGSRIGVNQTDNLEVVDGRIYDASGNSFVTVYFDNSKSNWSDVYCYAWSGDGDNATEFMGEWPGTKITETDYETASGGFYKALVPSQAEKVLFNVGSDANKTKDYIIKDGSIYDKDPYTGTEGKGYYPEGNDFFYPSTNTVEGCNVLVKKNGAYTCDALLLYDEDDFVIPHDFTAYGVSYDREVIDNQLWGTICMPFDLTSNDMVQYYTLSSVTSEEMVFRPEDEIPANTPAVYNLLDEEPDCLDIWYLRPLEISATNDLTLSSAPTDGWTMKGTYSPEGLVSGSGTDIYFIARDQVWRAARAISVNPFRAWFETSTPPSGAQLRIAIEGEAEGIQSIEMDKYQGEIIFDLMGRQSDSSRKGIVIKNGKVVFMK